MKTPNNTPNESPLIPSINESADHILSPPFEIPSDHGVLLLHPTTEAIAIFTPHVQVGFTIVCWSEGDAEGPHASLAGTKRGIATSHAWEWLLTVTKDPAWWNAKVRHLRPDDKWSGPWAYNELLYLSREEYVRLAILGEAE